MTSATATTDFVPVARVVDVPDGSIREFTAGGRQVFLARVGNKYYSGDIACPHMGANLAAGKLEGTILTCPRHASRFDLTDGRIIRWTDWTGVKAAVSKLFRAPRPLKMHQVKVEGDDIMIAV